MLVKNFNKRDQGHQDNKIEGIMGSMDNFHDKN
jgi:hypothetical protein